LLPSFQASRPSSYPAVTTNHGQPTMNHGQHSNSVSIIIPARSAAVTLRRTLDSLTKYACSENTEIIIVNDASEDDIRRLGSEYPVKIAGGNGNGIAAARNIGIQSSSAEILILLDADCVATSEWLSSHLEAHDRYKGLLAVGGSFCLEPNTKFWARCDHYCSWYNVHPYQSERWVPNHPGGNLSFSRSTYDSAGPFKENLPRGGVHEDFEWQDRLLRLGGRIQFEPRAAVWHVDRNDPKGYLRHNYRWGYNSIIVKSGTGISRFPWIYQKPWLLVAGFLPFAVAHTLYTIVCWLRAGKYEPLFLGPLILLGRIAYAFGMIAGWSQSTNRL
jgi:glycosyltransferase involved in cell wall biosynthesis